MGAVMSIRPDREETERDMYAVDPPTTQRDDHLTEYEKEIGREGLALCRQTLRHERKRVIGE
jgi:hypothetical protein